MKTMIDVNRIRVAEIRYFDKDHNGVEIPPFKAYAVLVKFNESYINLFDYSELPVYERVPYSMSTADGCDYGSRIQLISGEEENGLCYVLNSQKGTDLFDRPAVSKKDIEQFIFSSSDFFIDRVDLAMTGSTIADVWQRYTKRSFKSDKKKKAEFMNYIGSHFKNPVKKK